MRVPSEMAIEMEKARRHLLMGISTMDNGKMTSMMEKEFWFGLMGQSTMAIGKPIRHMVREL